MKKLAFLVLIGATVFTACKGKVETPETAVVLNENDFAFFGEKFALTDELKDKEYIYSQYQTMQKGDTVQVKFASNINEVCQKKGCWISLDLGHDKKSFVKFKDYGFFAPMNASGHEVVVNGKAFVSIISVDELKHYAKDAGKTEEDIAKIVEPKITYGFLADGIAIKNEKPNVE
ncbi:MULTISPECIES: DUF4920 domain-containing protein [Myroides]|uniref:DUF4920 domain-containing protein n=1 Tax=Myroides albus TaxID=2562892 RepID=A0A6I3LLN6_9FLAO|nr:MULTISPECIES: DUF4920 domain-containing protein [Myroides]MTG98597.1 DUF4920 domain-containing protein [Myroides albus]MVX36629.1 DUF4920 domain-containing protein [Myroides sp. LoEW2-1]UVD79967.1 DUF4920 domain-containing protein [Myroides albus]